MRKLGGGEIEYRILIAVYQFVCTEYIQIFSYPYEFL